MVFAFRRAISSFCRNLPPADEAGRSLSWRSAALLLGVVVLAAFWFLGGPDERRSGLGGIPQPLTGGEVVELELGEEGQGSSPIGEWLYVETVGPEGPARVEAYDRALEEAASLRVRTSQAHPRLIAARWAHAGPMARAGRVADVAVDPEGIVFAATAAGGVWSSEDGGLTWAPSWPAELTQAMGSIAGASDGTIYAGTGDPVPTRAFAVSEGSGVYRSTDGGASWEGVGLEESGSIGRIAADPTDPDRIFAAAAGSLFLPGGERGLYRSTDGGESWALILAGENGSTGAIDVATIDGRTVLAATWERDGEKLGGPGSGLHLSTDGGESWREVRLPGAKRDVGRIGVALAPSDPRRAYAIVSSDLDGRAVGLWRSDDRGRTWRRTPVAPESLNQSLFGWWYGRLWVDPVDPDRLFVGGLSLMVSADGGETVEPVGLPALAQEAPPISQHAMAWDLSRPGLVFLGTDGGMLRSVASGRDGTWVAATSQGWTQLFSPSGPSWSTIDPALTAGPGDAEPGPYGTVTTVVESRSDPDVSYMGTAEGALWRTTDAGGSWERLGEDGELPGTWVTGIEVHPSDPETAYAVFADTRPVQASMRVLATADAGSSWTELTGNLPSAPVNDLLALPGGGLVAGTDVGVFISEDPGSWLALGSGLPAIPVLDLRYRAAERTVTAATFGHGLQRLALP